MVLQIKWNFNLSVESGIDKTAAGTIDDATAYDKISVTIKSSADEKVTTVNLQPSNVADISLICITSDQYHLDDKHKLLYNFPAAKTESMTPTSPGEATAEAPAEPASSTPATPAEQPAEAPTAEGPAEPSPTETPTQPAFAGTKLENAHILIGNSLVSLLGSDIRQLNFVNTTGRDAHVEILIVRKASSE